MTFSTPIDIANRAIQHCGGTRIVTFTDDSKEAAETSEAYDKTRRAELRRNFWTFAIKTEVLRPIGASTMLLSPPTWLTGTTYYPGSIVNYGGSFWFNTESDNKGNTPGNAGGFWSPYYGSDAVNAFDSTLTYYAGELVYQPSVSLAGQYNVYVSMINQNADNPATPTAWSATTTYKKDQVVLQSATSYRSLISLNLNQNPTTTFVATWLVGTTYASGNSVTGSDGFIYTSVGSGNVGHDPTTDGGVHWTNTGTLSPWSTTIEGGGTGSLNWRLVSAGVNGLVELNIIYPLGAGPSEQTGTRNVFRRPYNFLREAPQAPKQGSTHWLGAPSALAYTDWVYSGKYILSDNSTLIVFRFVADETDVSQMDDMFCEGLGARIGMEIVEALTQSADKWKVISSAYNLAIKDARTINSIEQGTEEQPEDDYIACRL